LQLKKKSPVMISREKLKSGNVNNKKNFEKKNESEIPSISSFDYKKHKYYTNMKRKKRKTINCATK